MRRIICNMATFPPRRKGLALRIQELAPQCDLLRIYLNQYDSWPSDIPRPKNVEYILGNGIQAPDMGSQGKLYWLDASEDCVYLTVDDDICYSRIYVAHMVAGIDRYEGKAVVSLHGGSFRMPKGNIPDGVNPRSIRKLISYANHHPRDTAVMLAGGGIMAYNPMTLGMSKEDVLRGPLHSGDDEDVAVWCQRHKVPVIVIKHNSGICCADYSTCMIEAQFINPECTAKQNAKLRSWRRWQIIQKPSIVQPPKGK